MEAGIGDFFGKTEGKWVDGKSMGGLSRDHAGSRPFPVLLQAKTGVENIVVMFGLRPPLIREKEKAFTPLTSIKPPNHAQTSRLPPVISHWVTEGVQVIFFVDSDGIAEPIPCLSTFKKVQRDRPFSRSLQEPP